MCVCASNKEHSQRDNGHKLTTKRETTKTKDLQCMKTHALASTTLTLSVSGSLHTLFGFRSVLRVVNFNSCRCDHLLNFDLYANSLSLAITGLLRCCLNINPTRIHCKTSSMSARLVLETRDKCQDFVARYKDDGSSNEVDSPFCNASIYITVRESTDT